MAIVLSRAAVLTVDADNRYLPAADIRVEYGDLLRLEAAYSRATPSAADRDYLTSRLTTLETRARVSPRR